MDYSKYSPSINKIETICMKYKCNHEKIKIAFLIWINKIQKISNIQQNNQLQIVVDANTVLEQK